MKWWQAAQKASDSCPALTRWRSVRFGAGAGSGGPFVGGGGGSTQSRSESTATPIAIGSVSSSPEVLARKLASVKRPARWVGSRWIGASVVLEKLGTP